MKTIFFTMALLVAASLSGFAQDKASLKEITEKMIDLKDQENYTDLAEIVYPKVYKIISKEDYLAKQQKMLNGTGYKIRMVRIEPSIDYGAIVKDSDATYCVINYDDAMTVELEKKLSPEDLASKEEYFKKLLGTEQANYNEQNNTFYIKKRSQVIAIADESSNGQWTFADPTQPGVYNILPESSKKELNLDNIPDSPAKNQTLQSTQGKDAKKIEAQKATELKLRSAQKKV